MNKFSKLSFLLLLLALTFGCGTENESFTPKLSVSNTIFNEGNSDGAAVLNLSIQKSATSTLTFDYNIQEGTAQRDLDYIGENGSVTFQPGESTATLSIDLVNDDDIELNESFVVLFTLKGSPEVNTNFEIAIENDDLSYEISSDSEGFITPNSYNSMKLIWSDEFDQSSLNLDNWSYNLGNGCDLGICGWGNEELQNYTDDLDNVFLENGRLFIRAKEDAPGNYTSGRILSENKQAFKYGRVDIRAKLPEGQGIWPALWMLGTNISDVGWPQCGEIDIMELKGQFPDVSYGTIHYDDNGYKYSSGSTSLTENKKFSDEFHVFSILWDRNKIIWYIDYIPFKTVSSSAIGTNYPFNEEFYFIMNVAVGGLFVGPPDESTVFSQQMEIDYIRVFQ